MRDNVRGSGVGAGVGFWWLQNAVPNCRVGRIWNEKWSFESATK